MALSKSNPEERIRQGLIEWMVASCGYPRALISTEGSASQGRRFDVLCYMKQGEALVPLLLIECKAGALTEAAEKQLLGYNSFIQAPFICLANGKEIKTIWHEGKMRKSVPFLPLYQQLYDLCI